MSDFSDELRYFHAGLDGMAEVGNGGTAAMLKGWLHRLELAHYRDQARMRCEIEQGIAAAEGREEE